MKGNNLQKFPRKSTRLSTSRKIMAMIFRNANLPELLLHIIVQKMNVRKTKQI